jgi:hypothetical protein
MALITAYQTGESGLVTGLVQKHLHKGQLTHHRVADQPQVDRPAGPEPHQLRDQAGAAVTNKMLASADREARHAASSEAPGHQRPAAPNTEAMIRAPDPDAPF